MRPALQILLLIIAATVSSSTSKERPVIEAKARVKEHRHGARGELVPGEEGMIKVIVYWPKVFSALSYEICHGCYIIDATGERIEDKSDVGTVYTVHPDSTCGGSICHVFKNVQRGKNRFNVRVQTNDGWSLWSEHANFNITEFGYAEHEHDEL